MSNDTNNFETFSGTSGGTSAGTGGPPGGTSEEDALPRGAQIGRYVVLHQLGQGGMSTVYAAYDPELDRKVAIKLLRSRTTDAMTAGAAQALLLKEAQGTARLAHPNVIAIHDVGTYGEQVFVAMEFLEGQSMRDWLREPRPWTEILHHLIGAGRGLAEAHRLGMVHRDVKPDNIFIAKDGRARLIDFGVVHVKEKEPAAPDAQTELPVTTSSSALKAVPASSAVGTHGYMAPEQYADEEIDERVDQFAFASTMYEAMYRQPAFPGRTVLAVSAKVIRGDVAPPPVDTSVPAWIRRIIERGLRLSRDERFASMGAMLEALSHDPSVKRRQLLRSAGVASAVVVAAAAVGYTFWTTKVERQQRCRGGEEKLASVWAGPRKEKVRAAFALHKGDQSSVNLAKVEKLLDGYGASWAAMSKDSCEATTIRKEQSDSLMDLRTGCLDRRLSEMNALVDLLETADTQIVERSVQAAHSLSPLRDCADVQALTSRIGLPTELSVRTAVAQLRSVLDHAKMNEEAGKYAEALKMATEVLHKVKQLGYHPLIAEAYFRVGILHVRLGNTKEAASFSEEAALAGEASRHDEIVARALIAQTYTEAFLNGRPAEAKRVARRAEAAVARYGDPLIQAHLSNDLGVLYHMEHDYIRGLDHSRRAFKLKELVLGPNHPDTAITIVNLGLTLVEAGHYREAEEVSRRGLAIQEQSVGFKHPITGMILANLGLMHVRTKEYDLATTELERALPLLANDAPVEEAWSIEVLGLAKLGKGDLAAAGRLFESGLEKQAKLLPANNPQRLVGLTGLAQVFLKQNEPQLAMRQLSQALRIARDNPGFEGEAADICKMYREAKASVSRVALAAAGELSSCT